MPGLLPSAQSPTAGSPGLTAEIGPVIGGLLGAQARLDLPPEELERILRRMAIEVLRPHAA
jgi:hypothetical protein